MEIVSEKDTEIFTKSCCRLILAGVSGAGKTYLLSKLIRRYRHVFSKVYIIGSDLEDASDLNVIRDDNFNPLLDSETLSGHTLICFDDTVFRPSINKIAANIFVTGRHLNISAVYLTQNIFLNDKDFRIISLNATHIFLNTLRDLRQVRYFARSFLSDEQINHFENLYKKVVLGKKYKYLLVDFSANIDSPLRIRSNILNEDGYMRAYVI